MDYFPFPLPHLHHRGIQCCQYADLKSGDHWGPITQHSILLMVGAVIVVLVHNIPYKWFQVFPVFLLPISIGLLAFVMLMGFITGDRVNGAARWMTFMGIQFQPSEIAKMAVVSLPPLSSRKGRMKTVQVRKPLSAS